MNPIVPLNSGMKTSFDDPILSKKARAALRDIKFLSTMFSQGFSDAMIKCTDSESIQWDSKEKRLYYVKGDVHQNLEATTDETLARMKPFLADLVIKAKEFYLDDSSSNNS